MLKPIAIGIKRKSNIIKVDKIQYIAVFDSSSFTIQVDGSDGREIQIEAGQWLQTTANKLSKDAILTSIDNKFYLESIYKEINQIEKVKSREFKQLTLF